MAQPDKYGVYAAAFNFHDWLNSYTKGLAFENKINYGAVEEGAVVENVLTISNNAATETTLSAFELQGDGSDQLSIDSSACTTIAAGGNCELKISYNAKTPLGQEVTLTANSDNEYRPKVSVTISALFLKPAGVDIATATDSEEINWFSDANYPWVIQSDEFKTGETALKAAAINDNESSLLMAKVKGPAKLLFHVKAST
ncbi:MAG: hypothetical protein HRT38_17705 [Alteromonadaceae bacterium]|nr:hypothetical protein [Alteromonadaceae bacterium]